MDYIRKKQGCLEELRRKQETVVIGIIGVHSGAGATTMSVSMANYVSAFLKKSVAVYEYNEKNHFAVMGDLFFGEQMTGEGRGAYTYKKTDYYCRNSTDIVRLEQDCYDTVIIDFGSRTASIGEFLRCRHKIVMSALEPWHYARYEKFCRDISEYAGSDACLHILHGDSSDITGASRRLGVCAVKRPVIDNPFVVNTELIKFFQTLF